MGGCASKSKYTVGDDAPGNKKADNSNGIDAKSLKKVDAKAEDIKNANVAESPVKALDDKNIPYIDTGDTDIGDRSSILEPGEDDKEENKDEKKKKKKRSSKSSSSSSSSDNEKKSVHNEEKVVPQLPDDPCIAVPQIITCPNEENPVELEQDEQLKEEGEINGEILEAVLKVADLSNVSEQETQPEDGATTIIATETTTTLSASSLTGENVQEIESIPELLEAPAPSEPLEEKDLEQDGATTETTTTFSEPPPLTGEDVQIESKTETELLEAIAPSEPLEEKDLEQELRATEEVTGQEFIVPDVAPVVQLLPEETIVEDDVEGQTLENINVEEPYEELDVELLVEDSPITEEESVTEQHIALEESAVVQTITIEESIVAESSPHESHDGGVENPSVEENVEESLVDAEADKYLAIEQTITLEESTNVEETVDENPAEDEQAVEVHADTSTVEDKLAAEKHSVEDESTVEPSAGEVLSEEQSAIEESVSVESTIEEALQKPSAPVVEDKETRDNLGVVDEI